MAELHQVCQWSRDGRTEDIYSNLIAIHVEPDCILQYVKCEFSRYTSLQIETATGTVQTTFSLHLHKRRAKKNFLTLLTDHNRTVLNEEHYLSITAYSKTATLKI